MSPLESLNATCYVDLMATIDPKLAVGYARQAGRRWNIGGRAVRAANFRVGQGLVLEAQAANNGRIRMSRFNVAAMPVVRSALASPGVARVLFERAMAGRPGNLETVSLAAMDVVHIRGDGADYTGREWGMSVDWIGSGRRRPEFRFATLPLLVDQHFVARWIERNGNPDVALLPHALGEAIPLALLYRQAALRLPHARRSHAIDVVIPTANGVIVGGTELVASDTVGEEVALAAAEGQHSGNMLLLAGQRSRLVSVVSLRTFMPLEMLSPEQRVRAADIGRWMDSRRPRIRADTGLMSDLGTPDQEIVEEFLPICRSVQRDFWLWRSLLRKQGYQDVDFDTLRESWSKRNEERFSSLDDPDLAARVARMMFVPPGDVRLSDCVPETAMADVTGIAAQAPGFSHGVSGKVESIDSLLRTARL